MEMVGAIMVIMAIMFPTITVEEAEVDTTITEVAELQIDQIHRVPRETFFILRVDTNAVPAHEPIARHQQSQQHKGSFHTKTRP